MTRSLVAGWACVIAILVPRVASGQSCKPDLATKDKITKQEVTEWTQSLYQTSFMAAALASTSEINITGSIARVGDENLLGVVLTKQESKPAKAIIESPYKAVKGSQILFGFQEGGDPISVLAERVGNNVSVDMFGKLNTKIVLQTVLKDEDLRPFRDQVGTRHIDSVRISLDGGLVIEKGVKDKNGRKFTEAISCFIAFAEKRGYIK
jgi:hypothetical protein